jgi:hypothetical protein
MVMNDKLALALEHYHYDIFEANLERFDYRVKLSFGTDLKGNIAQIAIQMEPMANDVLFTRMPDRRLTEKGFLVQFAGVYDLQKTPMTVALRARHRISLPDGQDATIVIDCGHGY